MCMIAFLWVNRHPFSFAVEVLFRVYINHKSALNHIVMVDGIAPFPISVSGTTDTWQQLPGWWWRTNNVETTKWSSMRKKRNDWSDKHKQFQYVWSQLSIRPWCLFAALHYSFLHLHTHKHVRLFRHKHTHAHAHPNGISSK